MSQRFPGCVPDLSRRPGCVRDREIAAPLLLDGLGLTQPADSAHALTFRVTAEERAAGFTARCDAVGCGALFRNALDWLNAPTCPVVP